MMYYIIIAIFVALISIFNIFFLSNVIGLNFIQIILWTVALTIIVIIIDGIFAFIVRRIMPKKLYTVDKKHFIASKRLRFFYEKIGVKKWKDKILELGVFTGFSKSKILEPKNNDYIERFILECNYGVGVHVASMIMGFLILFLCPKSIRYSISLPVAMVNLVLNYLPYVVLRYNLYKLNKLYEINLRREIKKVA